MGNPAAAANDTLAGHGWTAADHIAEAERVLASAKGAPALDDQVRVLVQVAGVHAQLALAITAGAELEVKGLALRQMRGEAEAGG